MRASQMIRETRQLVQTTVDRIRPEQAEAFPDGFRNNLVWQVGHLLTTQELLILGLTGNKTFIPDEWKSWFAKGTSPADFTEATPDWPMLVDQLGPNCERVLGRLADMDLSLHLAQPYQTSTGPVLARVGDVAVFSALHEAIHLGIIKAYVQLLRR